MQPATNRDTRRPGLTRRQMLLLLGLGVLILSVSATLTLLWRGRNLPLAPAGLVASSAAAPTDPLSRGRVVYQVYCANCHGPDGRGDGPAAAELKPPPRDFSAADGWRSDSSAETLRRVIVRGIPGTAMPASGETLAAADLDAVIAFVQTLAPPPVRPESPAPATHAALQQAGFRAEESLRQAPALDLRHAQTERALAVADLRGRLVLLNFWGTSCAHCIKEFPHLEELARRYENRGLAVVCACADEDEAEVVAGLAQKHAKQLAAFVDPHGLTRLRYDVQVLPTVLLIDPNGRVLGRAEGALDWSAGAIESLLEHCLPNPATSPGPDALR
jgi:mono/diheme cytochrome c family protein/peroxiredoxin